MILIGLITQMIAMLTLKKNRSFYIIGLGLIAGFANFFDIFSDVNYFKLSIPATISYMVIHLIYLGQELKEKNIKPEQILFFSFIFATMNIHIIMISLVVSVVFNSKTDLEEKPKMVILAIGLLSLMNMYYFNLQAEALFIFCFLLLLGLGLLKSFTETSLSYFVVTSFVAINTFSSMYLYLLISITITLFLIRKILLAKRTKIIQNNVLDKLTFSLLIKSGNRSRRAKRTVQYKVEKDIKESFTFDILNTENLIDSSLVLLMISSAVYLGVKYGNI